MFFEQENVVFELLEVLYLDQSCHKTYNSRRNFDAISLRFESDTIFTTDNNEVEILDNSICYIPSNLNYTRNSKKDTLIVIHFKSFNYHSKNLEYFYPKNPEKYKALFEKLLICWNNKDISYKNECSSIFSKILAEFYKDNKPISINKKIYNSVLYIEKNCFNKDFSLSIAASKSYISETYFRKLFKQEFGMSPKQYIIERRIEYAKALIISGYFSVRSVAEMCGYNDEKYFSVEFKKVTGTSPSEYRYNFLEV